MRRVSWWSASLSHCKCAHALFGKFSRAAPTQFITDWPQHHLDEFFLLVRPLCRKQLQRKLPAGETAELGLEDAHGSNVKWLTRASGTCFHVAQHHMWLLFLHRSAQSDTDMTGAAIEQQHPRCFAAGRAAHELVHLQKQFLHCV